MGKLYVATRSLLDPYMPATPAEVAEAHPKCGTCEHARILPHSRYCTNRDSQVCFSPIDPDLDYCRYHPELTKEHDDDKA